MTNEHDRHKTDRVRWEFRITLNRHPHPIAARIARRRLIHAIRDHAPELATHPALHWQPVEVLVTWSGPAADDRGHLSPTAHAAHAALTDAGIDVVRLIQRHATTTTNNHRITVELWAEHPEPNPDPRTRARIHAAHHPELDLLTALGRSPHIIGTGGGCVAIHAHAGPAADPHRALYMLITTQDHYLATDRADIHQWRIGIYTTADDHALTCAEGPTFAAAYHTAWTAYHSGDTTE